MFLHSFYAAMTVAIFDLLCTFEVLTTHRTLVLMAATFVVTVIVAFVSCADVTEEKDAKLEFEKTLRGYALDDLHKANLLRLGVDFKNSALMKEISSLRSQLSQPVEISTVPTPAMEMDREVARV